jgi:cell division protein FtsL
MSDRVNKDKHWGQVYSDRALGPDGTGAIAIPRVREARDMVYSGTMPSPDAAPSPIVTAESRNRRWTRRTFSPFNIILALIAVAVVSVLYISNVLAVGRLLGQINELEQTHQRLLNNQELLRAQINKLSSLERIGTVAQQQLGLRTPGQAPVWLPADEERVQELEQALQERRQK